MGFKITFQVSQYEVDAIWDEDDNEMKRIWEEEDGESLEGGRDWYIYH